MPSTKTKRMSLYLKPRSFKVIQEIAAENGESLSQTAKMLIILGLQIFNSSRNLTNDEPKIFIDTFK